MHRVAILLFDEVEILDACGPFEVFSVASRVSARDLPESSIPFEVFTVAQTPGVRARHGLGLSAHYPCDATPAIDVLLVPGGVVTAAQRSAPLMTWLARTAKQCQLMASVCTGSFLLAQAGLLDGLPATTHWEDLETLQTNFPAIHVTSSVRWTEAGKIWTSAGISAGMDMSLAIVAKIAGISLAERTARQMDYRWHSAPSTSVHT